MAKVMATELAEELHATAIARLGPDAHCGFGSHGAVGDGYSKTDSVPRPWE